MSSAVELQSKNAMAFQQGDGVRFWIEEICTQET
jgi:hypothetical protein